MRVGIAGRGVMGLRRRAAIMAHPELTLVGDSDNPSETAALLELSLDAVFVCVPNRWAAPITVAALERGFSVFCEKPPARSLEEVLTVAAALERAPGQVMYGFNHRKHGSVLSALALAESGELGSLQSLRGVYGKPGSEGWRTDAEVAGGGILLDQGIHMLDLIRAFAGELTVVSALMRDAPLETEAYATLVSGNGVVAQLHSSAREPREIFRLEVVFERGRMTLDGILSGSMRYAPETLVVVRDGRVTRTGYERDDSWALEVADFAEVVIKRRPVTHGSIADARAVMALVDRINELARSSGVAG